MCICMYVNMRAYVRARTYIRVCVRMYRVCMLLLYCMYVCMYVHIYVSAIYDCRASTFYLSLARTGHLDICRAIRFQIVLARTMTNHSMYFSHGRPPHIPAVFVQSFATARRHRGASRSPACQSNTLTSVFRSRRTRYFNANTWDASGHFSPRSTWHGSE